MLQTTHRETNICLYIVYPVLSTSTERPFGIQCSYCTITLYRDSGFVYNTIELFYGEFANQKKGTWFIKLMKKMF